MDEGHDSSARPSTPSSSGPGRGGSTRPWTFHADGERQFRNLSGYENAVVVELAGDQYDRLVRSLDDPARRAAEINARAAAH